MPHASHLCWSTSSPCICVILVCPMSPGPALSHMGRRGAGHSSLAPMGRPCSSIEASGRLGQPLGAPTPSLTVAPGDLALRERELEPPAQHHLLSSRCRTRPGGRPGDGVCAQAVSGAAAACMPRRPVGLALVSDGHLCLWQEKGEVRGVAGGARAGSPPAVAGARRLCLRSALGSPEGSGSSSVQALPPALSVCHSALLQLLPARALLGVARALLKIYFQHPDDRFRAAAGGTTQFTNLSLD